MRFLGYGLLVIGAFAALPVLAADSVYAPGVPADLVKTLKSMGPLSVTVTDDVVRVVSNRSFVKTPMLSGFHFAYCYPVLEGKTKAWGGKDFKRIEIMNSSQSHGLAFVGGKKECLESGLFSDKKDAYIKSHTWVCVAGNSCRPRREGEVLAMDE